MPNITLKIMIEFYNEIFLCRQIIHKIIYQEHEKFILNNTDCAGSFLF